MKNEKIIATIKKVLELSKNNPSEEEAKAAALKAQELLAKYNIKESDINDETSENIVEKFTDVGLAKWKYSLASVIARNFRCQMFMCGRRIYFYGYETDTEVACSTFEYLYKVGDKKANAYTRKVKKEVGSASGVYNSFTYGFTSGVKEALDAQCTALMIVIPEEVKESYAEYSKDFGTKNTSISIRSNGRTYGHTKQAMYEGKQEGKSAMSARQIGC
jgi:hypothetical protein